MKILINFKNLETLLAKFKYANNPDHLQSA